MRDSILFLLVLGSSSRDRFEDKGIEHQKFVAHAIAVVAVTGVSVVSRRCSRQCRCRFLPLSLSLTTLMTHVFGVSHTHTCMCVFWFLMLFGVSAARTHQITERDLSAGDTAHSIRVF